MANEAISDTTVPANLTVNAVLAAGGAELTQDQFSVLAQAAVDNASKTSGHAKEKFETFSTQLLSYCESFGDDIPRRFVQVVYPDVVGFNKWTMYGPGCRLQYFATGKDKYRYLTYVF